MIRRRKVKVKVGDIFSIKIDENRFCYGQVHSKGEFCDFIIIFDLISNEHPPVKTLPNKPVIFLVSTVLTRIEDGLWEVLGNQSIPEIYFPKYKEETDEGYQLIDYLGSVIDEHPRKTELDALKELNSWSPISIENALRAKFIELEWDSYYDDLIYEP
ncbi:Imm26 family immunity protein [Rossellomorea sp. NPDC077527]|uniref:Imm26 family immunity protein n=1 Tax=Rossellomorea sp. NPDC077527 TaxID=3364510 RepID=UPI0037C9FD97